MTDAQKECKQFEELSEYIVRYIFKNTEANIVRTPGSKDGGYDIVAECNDGKISRKVYFECKLRSGNLNLRDIAANAIIAFNEGAVALVVFTNYNYTVQADENLRSFCRKTILNIKIVIGEEINKVIENCDLSVSKGLAKLIMPKKSLRNIFDPLLQIDFSKFNLHEELLNRNIDPKKLRGAYIPERIMDKKLLAQNIIKQGGLLAVSGFIGIGKHMFVDCAVEDLKYSHTYIDAALHETQERLLLDILMSIWGIPTEDIIKCFTTGHIDSIIKSVDGKLTDINTTDILRRLLGKDEIKDINSETYNLLICNYIIDLLHLHNRTFQYLFHIDKLPYAKAEVTILLKYFIKRLHQIGIPCVVIHDSVEYSGQQPINLNDTFGFLDRFFLVELNMYTKNDAIGYIRHCCPEISNSTASLIVAQVGVRQSNIAQFLTYLKNTGISLDDNQRILYETQTLTPNNIPAITGKILEFYRGACRELFDILFLLNGKVQEKLFEQFDFAYSLANRLVEENILAYHQEYFVCANPIIWAVIKNWGSDNSPILNQLARKLLQAYENDSGYFDVRAYLLRYIGKNEQALTELLQHILQLESERQFDALISSYDMAAELAKNINAPLQIQYIVRQLEILAVKKELSGERASTRLNKLSELLKRYEYMDIPQHYLLAYEYFKAKRDFKNGLYDINTGTGLVTRQYFEKSLTGICTDNTGDWLGKLCYQYALNVKESQGDDDALVVITKARQILPDSYTIWREYYSHLACMRFYDSPDEAFEYYEKIISSFRNNLTLCALPFHEYVDKAMCKLLSGKAVWSENLAQEAIEICESNSVLDEWGRALNIKGCALLCQNKPEQAKTLFKESSDMLKSSGYKLYSWRSQLNYIQMALGDENIRQSVVAELEDAYQCFKNLLGNKIGMLANSPLTSAVKTREYHALLAFGLCFDSLKDDISINIFNDFEMGRLSSAYNSDLHKLKNSPATALTNSPYFKVGKILMVG